MTSRGRVTIPQEIREKLGLKMGSRISFWIDSSGRVVLQPLKSDFRSLRGMLRSPHKRPLTIEEMDEAIGKAVCEDYKRSVSRR
jgi:antitoxin PrlF